jgi:hypothetical protein
MQARSRLNWLIHLAAAAALAVFVGALYYSLLFTNRVLATGDILLYFYPYRDYVASALREGRLPFWNPYLFGGAPLLANPQAAVLYPLHWPLIGLPVTAQVYWSAAIHTWLFGLGGYWLLWHWRRLGAGEHTDTGADAGGGKGAGGSAVQTGARAWTTLWGCLVTALLLSGAGVVGGLLGHLNQLNVAAWAPWAVLCIEGVRFPLQNRARRTPFHSLSAFASVFARSAVFAVIVALMLLAGHTQTIYIVLFGVGAWCLWPLAERRGREVAARLAVYTAGVLIGALLSAPQLLPTLELSGLGLRTGGLSYLEATSFSLKPLQLPWTLLPSYGLLSMQAVFDTPAYTEFIAYVGLAGLFLALIGAWRGRGRARAFGLLFVVLGLALGLGRWNPLYFLLHAALPGFDLFRVPARWMLLYTIGAGVLGGLGAQVLLGALAQWWARTRREGTGAASPMRLAMGGSGLFLALLVAADLLLAARALPHTHPTAPEAVDGLRSAPAHLLTGPNDTAGSPAANGRFLGLSTITYDPGDMPDYRRIMVASTPPQLDQGAFDDLVIAQKVQELLVPNLALLWRIPTIDGFDGGVLPLQRYNQFAQLLIPPEEFVPDGRLREQLAAVPPAALLNLMNVQYLIADKVRDLWFDDVYYDRQIGARLTGSRPAVEIPVDAAGALEATHLDLIAYAEAPAALWAELAASAVPIAEVVVRGIDGRTGTFPLAGGGAEGAHIAGGLLDSPLAASSGATVAYRDVEAGREEYRVRLALDVPFIPVAVEIRRTDDRFTPVIQAATLYDARTGMFTALLPSDRGRFARVHSGDVKIYENLDLLPRAYVAAATLTADSPATAAARLQEQLQAAAAHPPNETAAGAASHPLPIPVIEGPVVAGSAAGAAGAAANQAVQAAEIVSYAPERVEVRTRSAAAGVLVLADAFYPGWRATVDGRETPIYPANVLYRAVPLPAGEHTVIFTFTPTGWRLGLTLAAVGGVLLAVLGFLAWWGFRRQRANKV